MKIYIDSEFRDLLPTPSPESLQELEKSLIAEGCREPLIAWRYESKLILLDGHTRYTLCRAHKLKYRVLVKPTGDIRDREAAKEWILQNQLARRNLTREEFTLALGKLYNAQKAAHGGDRKSSAQNEHLISGEGTTAEKLAREHGTSAAKVRRAGKFAEAVEKIKEQDPDIERKVVKGEMSRKEVLDYVQGGGQHLTPEMLETLHTPDEETQVHQLPKDADGRDIPAHLIGVFATQEQFKRFAQTLSTLKGQVKQAIEENPVAWSQFSENEFRSLMQRAHDLLKLSGPFIVCAYCGGDHSEDCRSCKGAGFLSRAKARCAPKELRP